MKAFATVLIASGLLASTVVAPSAYAGSTADLTVATFNICNVKCGTGEFAWAKRAPSVVRNIVSSRADIVAVQEADNGSIYWLTQELDARGYSRAEPDSSSCGRGCVPDSHVFYRRDTVEMSGLEAANEPVPELCRPFIDSYSPEPPIPRPQLREYPPYPSYPGSTAGGQAREEYDGAVRRYEAEVAETDRINDQVEDAYWQQVDQWWAQAEDLDCRSYHGWTPTRSVDAGAEAHSVLVGPGAQDRNMAWAILRHRGSGSLVVAASVHLPNEKTPGAEKLRRKLARAIPAYLKAKRADLGVPRVPTVIMGDLNSYYQRQPRGAQWVLGKQGFRDVYTANKRVNGEVPTINITSTLRNPFPAKPFRFDKPARLDYILFDRGKARKYEIHLKLKGKRFDNRYRSSDHNLVKARLRLPSVTG